MDSVHKLGKLIQEANDLFNSINITSQMELLEEQNKQNKNEMKELIENYNQKCDELTNLKNKYEKDIGIKNKEIKEKNEELTRLTKISLIQQYDKQVKEKNEYIKILESQLEKYKNSSKPQSPKLLDIISNGVNKEKTVQEEKTLHETNVKETVEETVKETVEETVEEPVEETVKEPVEDKPNRKKTKKNTEEPIENVQPELQVEIQIEKPKKKKNKKVSEDTEFNPNDFEDVNGYELIVYKEKYYLRDLETNELYDIVNNQPNQVVGLINSKGRVKFN